MGMENYQSQLSTAFVSGNVDLDNRRDGHKPLRGFMPFGKDYEKMVLIEIKHCIDRAEYKVVFIALMILNIASYILCVKMI